MTRRAIQQEGTLHQHLTGQDPPRAEPPPGRGQLERLLLRTYLRDLASASWRVRKKGANGLGALGEAAWEAAPELARLLDDPDPRVREAAGNALARVNPGQEP